MLNTNSVLFTKSGNFLYFSYKTQRPEYQLCFTIMLYNKFHKHHYSVQEYYTKDGKYKISGDTEIDIFRRN